MITMADTICVHIDTLQKKFVTHRIRPSRRFMRALVGWLKRLAAGYLCEELVFPHLPHFFFNLILTIPRN